MDIKYYIRYKHGMGNRILFLILAVYIHYKTGKKINVIIDNKEVKHKDTDKTHEFFPNIINLLKWVEWEDEGFYKLFHFTDINTEKDVLNSLDTLFNIKHKHILLSTSDVINMFTASYYIYIKLIPDKIKNHYFEMNKKLLTKKTLDITKKTLDITKKTYSVVHIRYGDKLHIIKSYYYTPRYYTYILPTTEYYVDMIHKLLTETRGYIYILTDSKHITQKYIYSLFKNNNRVQLLDNGLFDSFYIMSHAHNIVTTYSTFSNTAVLLSNTIKNVYIFTQKRFYIKGKNIVLTENKISKFLHLSVNKNQIQITNKKYLLNYNINKIRELLATQIKGGSLRCQQPDFSVFKHKVTDSYRLVEDCRKVFIDFYKKHDPEYTLKAKGVYFPFIVMEIKNSRVYFKKDFYFSKQYDNRIEHIYNMLNKTLKYKKSSPDTMLYFWVSDRVPWELGDIAYKYPFYVFAKPKNFNSIIFPDTTFECLTLHKKYRGRCFDWDQMKELFKQKNREFPEKQKIIYFKGTPTTKKIHKIREALESYAKNKDHMVIALDGWVNYEHPAETTKYLFLLNLPGHYPWSNRFKYLFLTGSVVININVFTRSINEEGWDEEDYCSYIDLIMKPDIDYINIDFTYYNAGISKSKVLQQKAERMTSREIDNVIKKIENLYLNYDKNKNKYDSMIKSYRRKIDNLNNEKVYDYIYDCITENAKIIKG